MSDLIKNKTILVTAGTGFIGAALIEKLIKLEAQVTLLTRQNTPNKKNNINVITYNQDSLINKLKEHKFDIIFHIAAKIGYEHQELELDEYIQANISLGTKLLEYIKNHAPNAIFINTSTYWEHQDGTGEIDPLNLYATTKLAFQNILKFYSKNFNISSLTLKLFDVYSLKDTRKKLINLIIEQKELDVTEGSQFVDFTHIDDVVEAYIHAVTFADSSSPKYSVASGSPIQLKEIFKYFNNHPSQKYKLNIGEKKSPVKIIQKPYAGELLPNWKTKRNILEDIKEYLNDQ
jgi:CDP-paratose synthetase